MAQVLALAALVPPRPNHGSVTCEACGRMVPALDPAGSYQCTCGQAVYVDAGQPPR